MEHFNITDVMSMHLCYESEHLSYILCMFLYVFLGSLTIVTICGNLLVIISIIYFKQLHTPTNYLILSLAVADLLVGTFICPFNMAFSLTSCLYHTSLICKIRGSFDIVISTSSILNLCCISVDRYYAVCLPLMYRTKINEHVAVIMSLGSWGVSILTGIVLLIRLLNLDTCEEECFFMIIMASILAFYLPAILLLSIYFKIFLVAQKQARSIQNTTCKKSGAAVSKMEKKATKTLAIVMGAFLICWTPIFLCYAFQPLSTTTLTWIEPLNWLALSNSTLNPFIYAFFYSWFRSAFRMIISGKIFQGDFANSKLY
ncbi:trace amine-associated receptor 1-like [Enoplosus armatus]|uniref:trace amine-associated receptor 1-like n=1 Tax=Enoplosus armatus TaxID=215367 RepID=UPI00399489E2